MTRALHSGYISPETMRSPDDSNLAAAVPVRQNMEAWETWKNSETRTANEAEFKDDVPGSTESEHYSLGFSLDLHQSGFCQYSYMQTTGNPTCWRRLWSMSLNPARSSKF